MVMAVRGAIQVQSNQRESITDSVVKLIEKMVSENEIPEDEIISIVFSQTKDLNTMNPATALRETGFSRVPLFCCQEPDYPGSLARTVRVLLTFNAPEKRHVVPVYLDGAEMLRADLFKK